MVPSIIKKNYTFNKKLHEQYLNVYDLTAHFYRTFLLKRE